MNSSQSWKVVSYAILSSLNASQVCIVSPQCLHTSMNYLTFKTFFFNLYRQSWV